MILSNKKKQVGIGLIGSGFMGKAHANAFRAVSGIFNLPVEPTLEIVADINEISAKKASISLGFSRYTSDWLTLINDPMVDIVAITTPNVLHEKMSLSAISNGQTVYCEKPLSINSKSAKKMKDAAKNKGIITMVGFSFLQNPMIKLAKAMIESNEIGKIISFKGIHAENYMPENASHTFRTDHTGGGGALMDLGSHIISIARYLLGPIEEVVGVEETIIKKRKNLNNKKISKSKVDDRSIFIARFQKGYTGSLEACWSYTGSKMNLGFEIIGSKAAISFNQQRMNELLIYKTNTKNGRDGFTRIETGPEHPPYGNFCPAPGHHLGFNDLKIIEVAELLRAYSNKTKCFPDFEEAYEVQRIVDAIKKSSKEKKWIKL